MNSEICTEQNLNSGQIFFMTLSFIPLLFCLPCWVVAKFIYQPYVHKIELENNESEEVLFEKKFPIDKANDNNSDERDFDKNIVLVDTPDGLVYMKFSKENEGFEYWADNTIRYKYLETVARKYVTVFSCKNLYIDRFALLNEKLTALKEQIKKNKEAIEAEKLRNEEEADLSENEEEEDVFASLKSYNKKDTTKVKTQDKILRDDVVCDKANKYMKRGKIKDAVFGKKPESKESEISSLSFSSWKLWRKGKTD